MPLSDHEQRLLDQIEQALYAEDPKFAANVRSVRSRRRTRRWIPISIVGVLAGFLLVLVGLIGQQVAVSVIGFVLILAAMGYAARMFSLRSSNSATKPGAPAPSKAKPQGLRARMEDRLRRRFDQN